MDDHYSVESPRKKLKLSRIDGADDSVADSWNQREIDVGITSYVSLDGTRGFSGILKKRYTDFLVNEILPNGEVLHLRNTQAPRQKRPDRGGRSEANPQNSANVEAESADVEAPPAMSAPAEKVIDSTTGEINAEDIRVLKEYFSEADIEILLALHQKILASPRAKPSELGSVKASVTSDRSLRTKIHQEVRRIFGSKVESSTDKEGAMILSAAFPNNGKPANQQSRGGNPRGQGKLSWEDRGGQYLHFSIYKENKDTMEVLSYLSRQMKINMKTFQFAGTKDRRGVTVQRASAYRVEAERLAGLNKWLKYATVGDFGYHKHGLELGDLKGNEFIITLKDCKWEQQQNVPINERISEAEAAVSRSLRDLQERGYFNYYGLQRFGTFATRTDAVGVKILQGDFKGACDAILAFSSDSLAAAQDPNSTEMISQDDKARAEAIHIFQSTGKVNEALDRLPRKFSAESNLIRQLGRQSSDYSGALQTIPRNLKSMYVHAYQSLVWNFAVGERWRLYGDRVVEGDLVMVNEHKEKTVSQEAAETVDADGEIVIQPAGEDRAHDIDEVFERARALTAGEAASGAYSIFDVVLPLPGYDILYPENDMGTFYSTFMKSERGGGLDPYDMRRSQKDFSLSGSYRKVLARIMPGYELQIKAYENDDEQFVVTDMDRIKKTSGEARSSEKPQTAPPVEASKVAVILKFQLGTSQYATMALRELTKGGVTAYKPDFGGGR